MVWQESKKHQETASLLDLLAATDRHEAYPHQHWRLPFLNLILVQTGCNRLCLRHWSMETFGDFASVGFHMVGKQSSTGMGDTRCKISHEIYFIYLYTYSVCATFCLD